MHTPWEPNRFRKIIKDYSSILILLLSSVHVDAQAPNDYPKDMPVDFPLSPTVSAMQRFGDHPVDYHTGMIDLTIPFFTFDCGKIKIPVSIKNHASGRRPKEESGVIGFAWTLNAGGVITRKLKGTPDERVPNILSNAENRDYSDVEMQQMIRPIDMIPNTEIQPDIFSYFLPDGKCGKFVLKKNNSIYSAVTLPYDPIKITINVNNSNIESIIITDTNGDKYFFEKIQKTYYGLYTTEVVNMAWYLSKIQSCDGKDIVGFTYGFGHEYTLPHSEVQSVRFNFTFLGEPPRTKFYQDLSWMDYVNIPSPFGTGVGDSILSETPYIKGIGHNDDNITFNYEHSFTNNPRNNLLKNVVYTHGAEIINVITLNQRYTPADKSIYLDNLLINTQSETPEKYSFEYYNTCSSNCNLETSKDWWGYFNGYNNGNHLIPLLPGGYSAKIEYGAENTYVIGFSGVSREPNENAVKHGMIKKIVYPTGGNTEFTYETNKYGGSDKIGGGLRIKKIINNDGNSITEMTFQYGSGYLAPNFLPNAGRFERNMIFFEPNTMMSCDEFACEQATFKADVSSDLYDFTSGAITYSEVSVIESDRTTTYYYNGQNVCESDETNYNVFANYNEIKNDNIYYTGPGTQEGYTLEDDLPLKYYIDDSEFWRRGKLTSKEVHHDNKVDTYNYYYTPFIKETYRTLYGAKRVLFQTPEDELDYAELEISSFLYGEPTVYTSKLRVLNSANDLLTKTVCTTQFDYGLDNNSGEKKDTTFQYYSDLTHFLSKEEVLSNGKLYSTFYYYPYDYSVEPFISMCSSNVISPIVETKKTFNGASIVSERVLNNFIQLAQGQFAVNKKSYQFYGQLLPEDRLIINNFDSHGNPLFLTRNGNDNYCIIWGYRFRHPIAIIRNATYSEVLTNLGAETPETIASASTPNTTIINSLRSKLPNASITTFTYHVPFGVATVTDPRGITTTYEYNHGKLSSIKDSNLNILNYFEYMYSNH